MALALMSGTVSSDEEDIYWELAVDGADDRRPVVVLCHGAGGSHAIWYQQVPALGRHFRVLTWDSRGFGNSTNRAGEPGVDAAIADLGAVLDDLGVDTAHLIGQSMGGWHSVGFALASRQRVLSLTLADTVGGLWTEELETAFADFSRAGGLVGEGPQPLGGHRALWPGTAERSPAHAFLYQALGSFHSPPMDRLGETIRWKASHDDVGALGVPLLFIAGAHDQIFPAPLLAASARLIPGARYVEIPAAGHSPYFEQPEAWNDAVCSFLLAL